MKMDFGLGVISVIDGIAVSVKALQKNQHLRLTYARNVNNTLSLCFFSLTLALSSFSVDAYIVSFPLLHVLL